MANVAALSPKQIRQIDELCDAMDRECIMAGTATGHSSLRNSIK